MTLTNERILNAYVPLQNLYHQKLQVGTSKKLFDLIHKIRPVMDFQIEQEQQFLEEHPPVRLENDKYVFSTPEDANAFRERLAELAQLETDIDDVPLIIETANEPVFEISGNDIEKLQPLVEIK